MADLNIVIAGAGGRMGAAVIRMIAETKGAKLIGALDRGDSPALGMDAGVLAGLPPLGVKVVGDTIAALKGADAVIDFTTPAASVALAKETSKAGLVHVIGTTGCSAEEEKVFHAAAKAGARVVKSGNMSLGVNLLASLVKKAAAALGREFDIEIVEMHHRRKVDAPSGTALMLGKAAAEGRGIDIDANSVRVRDGHTGPRTEGTIGFATLRGGTVIGDHSVILAGPSERLELKHVAEDRGLFANGAVRAAIWAASKSPGYYSMADVLGLND